MFGPDGLSSSDVSTSLDYRLLVCSIIAYLALLFFSCSYRFCYLTAQFCLKPLFKENKALVRGYMWLLHFLKQLACGSTAVCATWTLVCRSDKDNETANG